MATITEAALEYNALGWAVIRLMDGRKRPPQFSSWEKWQTQQQTPADVKTLFRGGGKPNLGIITGAISGLVVVDVDTYHGGSTDGLPPTGVIAKTGRGGLQYFYRHPGGDCRPATNVRQGIDIRADGAYVCAAPSDTTGNPDNEGEGGPYTWLSFEPDQLGEAPEWALIRNAPADDAAAATDASPSSERWVSELLRRGAEPGTRNSSLTRLAGYYAFKGFPFDLTLQTLEEWNANKLKPPLPDGEVLTTIKQAYKMEKRSGRQHSAHTEQNRSLAMTPMADYMLKHGGHETKWIIKDWLPEGTICMLASPPQSYKTYSAFDLAISVASGQAFLGQFPVMGQGPVAIFQQEDPHANIAERNAIISLTRLGVGSVEIDDDGTLTIPMVQDDQLPIYFHEDRQLRFDDAVIMDALEAFIAQVKPKLVIIDPLYSAADTEDYMAKAAQQMMRLKTLRDTYGTSFIIVHHTNKSMDSWDRQKLWGSQFLNAFIESSWLMRTPPNEHYTVVLRHFKVAGPQPFVRLSFDIEAEQIPWRYSVQVEEISAEEAEKVVRRDAPNSPAQASRADRPTRLESRVLDMLTDRGAMDAKQLSKALKTATEDVDKALLTLLHKHRISQDPDRTWHSLELDLDLEDGA